VGFDLCKKFDLVIGQNEYGFKFFKFSTLRVQSRKTGLKVLGLGFRGLGFS